MPNLKPLLLTSLLLLGLAPQAMAQNCGSSCPPVLGDLQSALSQTPTVQTVTPGLAITDFLAYARDGGPSYTATDDVIPLGTAVETLETATGADGKEYAHIREVLPEGSTATAREWWTLASNIGSDREFDADMVPTTLIPLDGLSGDRLTMAQIYNTRGAYIEAEATRLGVDAAGLAAVLLVESNGHGFDEDGRMIIRFENHIFRSQWGSANSQTFNQHFRYNSSQTWTGHYWRQDANGTWQSFHGDQDKEWQVLEYARGLNGANEGALNSISMGAAQVMGFNHDTLGYDSAQDMFDELQTGIRPQLDGMIAYIENNATCMRGLRGDDYTTFATGYNGSGQAAVYGERIGYWAGLYNDVTDDLPDAPAVAAATPDPVQPTPDARTNTNQRQRQPPNWLQRRRGR